MFCTTPTTRRHSGAPSLAAVGLTAAAATRQNRMRLNRSTRSHCSASVGPVSPRFW